jgi:hypothetical protein
MTRTIELTMVQQYYDQASADQNRYEMEHKSVYGIETPKQRQAAAAAAKA